MPFVPLAKRGGRPRTTDTHEVVNAMLYIASARCVWRLLPKCFPPISTVRRYFYAWRDAELFEVMMLVMSLREIKGSEASPSAGVIDSQSVKTTESGGLSGYDAPLGGLNGQFPSLDNAGGSQRLRKVRGVVHRMDTDRLDPHGHTTESKALSGLKNFRIWL